MTVNVDRLHQRAGFKDVIEMHGALFDLLCSRCELSSHHESVDEVLGGIWDGTTRILPTSDGAEHERISFVQELIAWVTGTHVCKLHRADRDPRARRPTTNRAPKTA